MGKKKGKGKGKAKGGGGGGAGGLPPPPEFKQDREGAIEAMLSFQIKGREEGIDVYTEETEIYKDKNYQQSSKNDQAKSDKIAFMRKLLEEARRLADKLRETETVSRGDVEKAMLDKVSKMRELEIEEQELILEIEKLDVKLKDMGEDQAKVQKFREETQYENKECISKMKLTMDKWTHTEEQIHTKLTSELEIAKHRIEQRMVKMSEKQRERTSEWLMHAMDANTKAEIADNLWLKEQIRILKVTEANLKKEIDQLEERNLNLMEVMYDSRKQELEASCKLLSLTSNMPHRSMTPLSVDYQQHSSSREGSLTLLPSSTSKLHSIASETLVPSRPLDIGLMSIEGNGLTIRPAPKYVSLPPIEEQRNPSLQITKPHWPVTNRMLKSVT